MTCMLHKRNMQGIITRAGWYHCMVVEYDADSHTVLVYRDGATETINLHSIKWKFAHKNGKPYLPFSTPPPIYPLKKQREAATLSKYVMSASQKTKVLCR